MATVNTVRQPGPAQYDLHMHTFWSYDATNEIRPYFERARELKMRCIAITEHHNIDSAAEISEIARDFSDIRWIPSAELTVSTSSYPTDLLCYNLPLKPTGAFAEVLEEYNIWQQEAGEAISRSLQKIGIPFDTEQRRKVQLGYRPERVVVRQGATHMPGRTFAKILLKLGYLQSEEEFEIINKKRAPYVSSPPYPDVNRVVSAVKEAGGVVVIAHPKAYFHTDDIKRMDYVRDECQLDGVECAHPYVPAELTTFYRDYCVRNGLLSTGGSDCHFASHLAAPKDNWTNPQEKCFANHIGQPEWLDELLERIDG